MTLTRVVLPLFLFTAIFKALCVKQRLELLVKIHDRHLIELWPTHYFLHICSAIQKNTGVQSLQQGLRPHLSSQGVI